MNRELLKQELTQDEARKYQAYLCPKKKWTIGVGWNFQDNGFPPAVLDEFEAAGILYDRDNPRELIATDKIIDMLLDLAINDVEKDLKKIFPEFETFSDNRQRALANMRFQLGAGTFRGFKKTIGYVRAQQWELASVEMLDSDWYRKDTPGRAQRMSDMIRTG